MKIHLRSSLLCIGLLVLTACQSTSSPSQNNSAKPHEIAALFNQSTPEYKPETEANRTDKNIDSDITSDSKPIVYDDLWQEVIANLAFDIVPTPRLQKRIDWYLKQPDYLLKVNKRAKPYLFHITQKIKQKGLPMDMVLLPFVESDFRPKVHSSQSAVGIWQLMDSTAYHFGVTTDEWYDGRQDVLASTDAALDYLVYLYQRFNGDWLHALAAYNTGEGRVKKAIRQSKKQGKQGYFWQLKLPSETADYVPKLLALSYLLQAKHPKFKVPKLPNYALTSEVDFAQRFDFSVLASLTGVSKNQLHRLNPGYLQHQSAPEGPHKILLPLTEKQLWQSEFFQRYFSQTYTVVKNDTFYGLARRFNTSVNTLMALNNKQTTLLKVGEVLKIKKAQPLDNLMLEYQVSPYLAQEEKKPVLTMEHEYIIQNGDSLWEISKQFNVPVKDLLTWNNLKSSSLLKPGKKLVLHLPRPAKTPKKPEPKKFLSELEQLVKPNTSP
ncbi:LysM peptidoglycan-binding domain-containing protein [Pseudoalteromonas phenolica]|uniref:Murein transglycosylase D n=2 Tax=Pseudoalteromonas phenolica TaxID=161398 RepID=A0A0S2JYG8_9GAMM|nr:LysM peptidoglycan-binding domain-containing protein [Pseudoalteromonas phenolica]ALO41046.1 Murein transglycosylase D [Pseudoalteromonas phenolica]MBE0354431.1 membrane-bound lytic murein transglycosylase D [Pseudoalteromonas phenolica O-BC30]